MVKASGLGTLPEKSIYRVTKRGGINTVEFRELGASPLEDDDVIAFIDTDGRRMLIGHDKEGAYKYEI